MRKSEIIWIQAVDKDFQYYSVKSSWLRSLMRIWAEEDTTKPAGDIPHDVEVETQRLCEKVLKNKYEPEVMELVQAMAFAEDAVQGILVSTLESPTAEFSLRNEVLRKTKKLSIAIDSTNVTQIVSNIVGDPKFQEYMDNRIKQELEQYLLQGELDKK